MLGKLKDYQVLDVLCGGTFYKVKHKVTNNIFAWKAYDCTAYCDQEIQDIFNEVKTISKVQSGNLLRYYDTILHNASKTLYFVLEYNSWQSAQELIDVCKPTQKYFSESFIWHLLLGLARTCKVVENLNFAVIRKCITPTTIYISDSGEVRVDCFQLQLSSALSSDLMRQVGNVIYLLCYPWQTCDDEIKESHYSDDLRDIVSFVSSKRCVALRPEVIIYHPTILSNIESATKPRHLSEILISHEDSTVQNPQLNKCDSEKAVEMCMVAKPCTFNTSEIPIYSNISPKQKINNETEKIIIENGSLSPTLAALALELPGYIPRCRRPYSEYIQSYNSAQKVSEETLSQQWMSRLISLKEREESLNKRERDLVVKETVNSPKDNFVSNEDSDVGESNGITLPAVIASAEKCPWRRRRRRRRSGSTRIRRQSYSYEDLDSSLSADTGDGSMIVTARKFTIDNMPRRNIFPDLDSKKVHFTPTNPFVGSDESVTLTFYELEQLESEGNHGTRGEAGKDIRKFKYLDLENVPDKRGAKLWSHASPSKQPKMLTDITNQSSLRKTPSKGSLTSRSSVTSRCSLMSTRSQWSSELSCSKVSEGYVTDTVRSSMRYPQTPTAEPLELKRVR